MLNLVISPFKHYNKSGLTQFSLTSGLLTGFLGEGGGWSNGLFKKALDPANSRMQKHLQHF